jgi:hypothetical protein
MLRESKCQQGPSHSFIPFNLSRTRRPVARTSPNPFDPGLGGSSGVMVLGRQVYALGSQAAGILFLWGRAASPFYSMRFQTEALPNCVLINLG